MKRIVVLIITSFVLCACHIQRWEAKATLIPINESKEPLRNKEMDELIRPYKQKLTTQLDVVIGYADKLLDAHAPESLLSNFTADALLKTARKISKENTVDFALVNLGGLRKPIQKGAITYRTVYEVMPFENELVILDMKGKDVNDLLQEIARKGGEGISGVKMQLDNNTATNILINNEKVDTERIYRIATSDYLANGNDGMTSLRKSLKKENTYLRVRDLLINYIQQETQLGKSIHPTLDQRIYVK
jgi:2',3'-cyclic-nucleotide 2'-phosphodiesterase (5'-nucleotidase family)